MDRHPRQLFFVLLLSLATLAGPRALFAQASYHSQHASEWQVGTQTVPSTLTVIQPQTTQVYQVVVSNTTTSAVVFTIQDQSANCNGGPCYHAFSIPGAAAAGQTQDVVIPLGGARFNGGVKWSASTANALNAWVQGAY